MDMGEGGKRWGYLWVFGAGAIGAQFLKIIGHKYDNMSHTYLLKGLIWRKMF
jgi:hypothetical protein